MHSISEREARVNQKVLKPHTTGNLRSPFGERIGRLIGPLPGNLVYFDSESRIQGMSDSALKEFGYRLDEVLGRSVTEFLPPDAARKCRVRHPDFWCEGDMTLELKVQRKDGVLYKVLAAITFDFDDNGDAAGAIAAVEILSTGPTNLWRERRSDLPYGLTDREHQVLEAAAMGKTSKQIGYKLKISHETVNRHIGNVLLKMYTSSRIDACVRGVREGWLSATRDDESVSP